MTKLICTTFLLLGLATTIDAQSFEGTITYGITYTPKTDKYSIPQLEEAYGTTLTYYHKDGFSREEVDSKFNQLTVWRHDFNRIYTKDHPKADTLYSESAFEPEMLGYEYEIYSYSDTILGRVCRRLRYMSDGTEKNYYFPESIKVDPKYYARYTRKHRREIMNLMGSVAMRIDLDYPDFSVTYRAIGIEEKTLRSGLFNVPKSKVEVKY